MAGANGTPADLITQVEAAELRGLDLQVVNNWVRRGRIRSFERYGKTLVSRSEVLSYEPASAGRPPKTAKVLGEEKRAGKKRGGRK